MSFSFPFVFCVFIYIFVLDLLKLLSSYICDASGIGAFIIVVLFGF
ncbi:MAG: hypothetical protein ACK52J_03445 [bacterium]